MRRRTFLSSLAALPALATPVRAETRTATPATLADVIGEMAGGGELRLAGGDYGKVQLRGVWPDTFPLVIRSADRTDPARFTEMGIVGVRNLIIESVVFDYRFSAGDPRHYRPFQIVRSRAVSIRSSLFEGDLAGPGAEIAEGYGTGFGLSIRDAGQIDIVNNEVRRFGRGMVINGVVGLILRGNDLHSLRSDGMNFAAVENVQILGNHIHDFERELGGRDHADMIQFWTNGTVTPTRNVLLSGNLLNAGRKAYTQSIFMRNEEVDTGRAGHEMLYQNIEISNNVILNAHLHGVTVGESRGLTISNNTVVHNAVAAGQKDSSAVWVPQIRVAPGSRDVIVARNVTSRIVGHEDQPDWRLTTNLLVQNRSRLEPGFYGTVFVREVMADPSKPSSFAPLPGGPLDGSGIGATWLGEGVVGPPLRF